jgi:hypothetical protein
MGRVDVARSGREIHGSPDDIVTVDDDHGTARGGALRRGRLRGQPQRRERDHQIAVPELRVEYTATSACEIAA